MGINKSKLNDIEKIIRGYHSHRITIINGRKASDSDVEKFICQIIVDKDRDYYYTSDGTVLELQDHLYHMILQLQENSK